MKEEISKGLPVSVGREISGIIALDCDTAKKWSREGKRVILVRRDTSPNDLEGMLCSVGVVTARGGMTSHASLVAREFNKPCVVGCRNLKVDLGQRTATFGEVVLMEGQEIIMNSQTGTVYVGENS